MRGKEIKINVNKNYTVKLGTVDNKKPKCIFFEIRGWAQPKENNENYNWVVNKLNKRLTSRVHKLLPDSCFNKNVYLSNLDLRSSGIKLNKRSFFNYEVTLYLDKEIENIESIKPLINEYSQTLINDVFNEFEYMTFHKRK